MFLFLFQLMLDLNNCLCLDCVLRRPTPLPLMTNHLVREFQILRQFSNDCRSIGQVTFRFFVFCFKFIRFTRFLTVNSHSAGHWISLFDLFTFALDFKFLGWVSTRHNCHLFISWHVLGVVEKDIGLLGLRTETFKILNLWFRFFRYFRFPFDLNVVILPLLFLLSILQVQFSVSLPRSSWLGFDFRFNILVRLSNMIHHWQILLLAIVDSLLYFSLMMGTVEVSETLLNKSFLFNGSTSRLFLLIPWS